MKLTPEQTRRFNALIWAFDAATFFQHDRVTDVKEIIRLAIKSRLMSIAGDLQDIIEFNNL